MSAVDPPSPQAWTRLVTRTVQGDPVSANDLVRLLYPHVVRIVRNHLPRFSEEEDICQEIFMKVFSRIDRYRGDSPFPHWVARIALNTCVDRLRHQRVRPELRFADLSEEEAEIIQGRMSDDAGAGLMPGRDGAELVEKLLTTLKPGEETVLRMLDLEQCSVREIGERTGWSHSKIKVSAMRARRKLRATLERLESEAANDS